jgi:hypothetical protein
MLPQNPPQPTCSYFPLKLSSVGIQTSKLMIESLVGVAVPATLQNAGSAVFVTQPGLPVVQPGGVLNVPPVTDWAAVTCACGKDRFTRPSQLLVAEAAVVPSTIPASETVESATGLKRRLLAILPSWSSALRQGRTPQRRRKDRGRKHSFPKPAFHRRPPVLWRSLD